jgi:3-dehydroquinate synthase
MKRLTLHGRIRSCRILVGESFQNLDSYCPRDETLLVTDRRVFGLHLPLFSGWRVLFIGRGEGAKTLAVVEGLLEEFLRRGADRRTTIAAVGGGVVCDVAGLAASLYMRGLRLGLVPTTLLAQVDAAVGGKNGVNFEGYKNLLGTFRQPDFVLTDPAFLTTLPRREIRNGLAEIVKAAVISDGGMVRFLEKNAARALALEPDVMAGLVERSLRTKIRVVESDEFEGGPRRLLNFGHTLGHALEKAGSYSHGQAVAVGMSAAARLSAGMGFIPRGEADRLLRLLRSLGLPTSAGKAGRKALAALAKDKKRSGTDIQFVFLQDALGRAAARPISLGDLKEALRAVC